MTSWTTTDADVAYSLFIDTKQINEKAVGVQVCGFIDEDAVSVSTTLTQRQVKLHSVTSLHFVFCHYFYTVVCLSVQLSVDIPYRSYAARSAITATACCLDRYRLLFFFAYMPSRWISCLYHYASIRFS